MSLLLISLKLINSILRSCEHRTDPGPDRQIQKISERLGKFSERFGEFPEPFGDFEAIILWTTNYRFRPDLPKSPPLSRFSTFAGGLHGSLNQPLSHPQQGTSAVHDRFWAQRGHVKKFSFWWYEMVTVDFVKMGNLAKFQETKPNVHFGGQNRSNFQKVVWVQGTPT